MYKRRFLHFFQANAPTDCLGDMRCRYKAWKQALDHYLQRHPRSTRKQTPRIQLVGTCVNTVFPRGVTEPVDDACTKCTEITVCFPELELPRQGPSKQHQPTISQSRSVVSQCAEPEFTPSADVLLSWLMYFLDHAGNADCTGRGATRGCVCLGAHSANH
jgi:hypothetical protein